MQGMPQPVMGYSYMPPMPASFNPYATLPPPGSIPYPNQFSFPQAPGKLSSYTFITILDSIYLFQLLGTQYYGTYPGTYAQQIQQGNYPHAGMNQQQDPNKPYGF